MSTPHSPIIRALPAVAAGRRVASISRFIRSVLPLAALICTIPSTWAAPSNAPLTRFTYTQYHMGVNARLVLYAPDQGTAERSGTAAFARIAALDTIMSDYRQDSELNRLCARAGGAEVPVSTDLFVVLRRAEEVARQSDGAFDITAGPLIRLWRGVRKARALPDPAELEEARKRVGWRRVHLDAARRTARLDLRGMQLDLGGIAKGYAADCAQQTLKKHGIRHALVELGGDLVVTGAPPGTGGWKIRVPNAEAASEPTFIEVADRAVSTSGDTEQFVVIGGRQYSHIVDPRTGEALTSRVQVTVVGKDGLITDPLSTALSVLGPDSGKGLLRSYPQINHYFKVLSQSTRGSLPVEVEAGRKKGLEWAGVLLLAPTPGISRGGADRRARTRALRTAPNSTRRERSRRAAVGK
jgi:thiamine biosynthesis lipoprotein